MPLRTATSSDILAHVSGTFAPEEDVVVLRKVARGDRDALGVLYDRYAGTLLGLGLRIVSNRREAEDVLHDVFLEAWRSAGDYDPSRGSVKTWFAVRMRSRCLDRIRAHVNARTEALLDSQEPEAAAPTEFALDGARVCALLETLPEAQRKVLELGYFSGLSCQQIADELGIPVGTVKSRVAMAMTKLRKDLGVSQGGSAA